ncbi:MAG: hypothetical protein DSY90_01855 [Deltaproteobacteria bacterium]|nr:MAG: hypothetical protein DSY90_01855 [Deltaproteobacteria bacterium]RTZ99369.1 MAG: hypothetical protein DSY89_08530 [Deltaproteobacteria bacterium]
METGPYIINKTNPPAEPTPPSTRRYHHRFDFEIGYLVESPCKSCGTRPVFPKCIDRCKILDNIHSVLAAGVSCSRRR